ncbi:MAG TPA: hypothetical protein VN112_00615 [Ensifer sp.]|nr:hypothetical protein [Ensifer sp.]
MAEIVGEPEHLTQDEVNILLGFVQAYSPVIVGGQSINIWSQLFHGRNDELDDLGPLTSKDLDFYHNKEAERALAASLENGDLKFPTGDDHTPSAAVVIGTLGGRKVVIDFMAQVKGVQDDSILHNSITFADEEDPEAISITLMHPLDCVRSRLANINMLGRGDEHSLIQAEASLIILDCYIDDQLGQETREASRRALRTLRELEFVIRDMHIGKRSDVEFGHRLKPIQLLQAYRDDERIDLRARDGLLQPILTRLDHKADVVERRLDKKGDDRNGGLGIGIQPR